MEAIVCVPLIETFDFCIECDKIRAFDGNAHCYVCGCDHPLGDLNDYSIDWSEWEELNRLTEKLHVAPFPEWFNLI